jgi:hypothetical protein
MIRAGARKHALGRQIKSAASSGIRYDDVIITDGWNISRRPLPTSETTTQSASLELDSVLFSRAAFASTEAMACGGRSDQEALHDGSSIALQAHSPIQQWALHSLNRIARAFVIILAVGDIDQGTGAAEESAKHMTKGGEVRTVGIDGTTAKCVLIVVEKVPARNRLERADEHFPVQRDDLKQTRSLARETPASIEPFTVQRMHRHAMRTRRRQNKNADGYGEFH